MKMSNVRDKGGLFHVGGLDRLLVVCYLKVERAEHGRAGKRIKSVVKAR